jgi:hypothetical protein
MERLEEALHEPARGEGGQSIARNGVEEATDAPG